MMRIKRPSKRPWARIGLVVLALQAALVGVWALVSPSSFFREFPGLGFAWVAALPPYNEHLVRDVGGLYLAFSALFFAAAYKMDRSLTRIVLVSWLLSALPHLVFHFDHPEALPSGERAIQTAVLAVFALIPLLVLLDLQRRRKSFG